MCDPQHPTALQASTACHGDSSYSQAVPDGSSVRPSSGIINLQPAIRNGMSVCSMTLGLRPEALGCVAYQVNHVELWCQLDVKPQEGTSKGSNYNVQEARGYRNTPALKPIVFYHRKIRNTPHFPHRCHTTRASTSRHVWAYWHKHKRHKPCQWEGLHGYKPMSGVHQYPFNILAAKLVRNISQRAPEVGQNLLQRERV
jgi:hypothetical protein